MCSKGQGGECPEGSERCLRQRHVARRLAPAESAQCAMGGCTQRQTQAAAALLVLLLAVARARRLSVPALPLPPLPHSAIDPEMRSSTPEMAEAAGYRVESHEVESQGYVLTLHRLPAASSRRPPVILQHGMLCSSDVWLVAGPRDGLAYVLADAGFDVWLPNARGNTYSQKHRTLSAKMKKYWIFSWHEMGEEDLPRVIDYVLEQTGHRQLLYVGHSMGTTMFYVMLSAHPQYAHKVRAMVSLAPVAFIGGAPTLLATIGAVVTHPLWRTLDRLDLNLFAYRKHNAAMWTRLCGDRSPVQPLCIFIYSSIIGRNDAQLNKTRLPLFLSRVQHGVTLRTLSHYNQLFRNGNFQPFDEGAESSNMKRYGRAMPPAYNLSNVRVPIALIAAENDAFVPREGLERLARELPMVVLCEEVASLNHLDLTWARDVRSIVNLPLARLLEAAVHWQAPWAAAGTPAACSQPQHTPLQDFMRRSYRNTSLFQEGNKF